MARSMTGIWLQVRSKGNLRGVMGPSINGAGCMTTTDWVRPTSTDKTGIFVPPRIEIHSWTPTTQPLARMREGESFPGPVGGMSTFMLTPESWTRFLRDRSSRKRCPAVRNEGRLKNDAIFPFVFSLPVYREFERSDVVSFYPSLRARIYAVVPGRARLQRACFLTPVKNTTIFAKS